MHKHTQTYIHTHTHTHTHLFLGSKDVEMLFNTVRIWFIHYDIHNDGTNQLGALGRWKKRDEMKQCDPVIDRLIARTKNYTMYLQQQLYQWYWVSEKNCSSRSAFKSEEKMHKKMKTKNLVHVQHNYGVFFCKKISFYLDPRNQEWTVRSFFA